MIVAAVLGAAWPISAYSLSPVALPALAVLGLGLVVALRRPEYGVAAVVALAPFTNIHVGGGKPMHALLPALAVGLLLYSLIVTRTAHVDQARGVLATLLVFVTVGVASSILAVEPSQSVTKLMLLLTAACLLVATVRLVGADRSRLTVVVGGALAALILAGGQGVLEYLTGHHGQFGVVENGVVVGRIQGAFGHPNQYGGFLATLMPLAAAIALTRQAPRALRQMGALGLALGLPALVWSYSRGALAAAFIGPVIWLILVRPRSAFAIGMLLALAVWLFAPSAVRERFQSSAGGDVALRSDIWAAAGDIYAERPILGVGIDNFSVAYAQLPVVPASASQRRLLHQGELLTPPHAENLYLNILAEEGLLGIVAFALFAFASTRQAYRGSRSRDPVIRSVCLGIGSGMAALAVHSVLDVGLYGEVAFPLFALIAVAAGMSALDRAAADKAQERSVHVGAPGGPLGRAGPADASAMP